MKHKIANQFTEVRTMIGQKMQPKHLAQVSKVMKTILFFITGMYLGGLIEAGLGFDLVAGVALGILGTILAAKAEKDFTEEAGKK